MASRRKRKSEPAPGWAWMLFGLSIGLAVALVVYLRNGPAGTGDFSPETTRLAQSVSQSAPAEPSDTLATSAEPPVPSDDEDADEEIGFSFPYLLEDSVVVVAESEFDFGLDSESETEVVIQVGSFPTARGADSRRADVALLGFESFIEHAVVRDAPYHRVIIGPLSDRGDINRTLRRLTDAGIESAVRVWTN